jgi:alanyl-tRNA synthetase
MTAEEIKAVEDRVNEQISADLPVVTNVMSIEEAKKTGAMALFGEKYGDTVRVVNMGDWSVELCGGTHVKTTSRIGVFKIANESGVAAGVRRIEALTGDNARSYYVETESRLAEAAKLLKASPAEVNDHIAKLLDEMKALKKENEAMKSKAAKEQISGAADAAVDVKGVKLLATKVSGVDMNGLRDLGDQLKAKLGEGVVLLLSDLDGKVNMVAFATDDAVAKGAHAGNLIKGIAAFVGGGGGGRPGMAQAGGKNPAGIDQAISEASKVLGEMIK